MGSTFSSRRRGRQSFGGKPATAAKAFFIGGLMMRIGFPLKKGVYKGSIVGFYTVGSLMIRIGFWGILYYNSNLGALKIVLVII